MVGEGGAWGVIDERLHTAELEKRKKSLKSSTDYCPTTPSVYDSRLHFKAKKRVHPLVLSKVSPTQ